jgi:hypothetical protein
MAKGDYLEALAAQTSQMRKAGIEQQPLACSALDA